MKLQEFTSNIRNLIADDKRQNALEILKNALEKLEVELHNDVILISANLSQLEREKRIGTIEDTQYNQRCRVVEDSILKILLLMEKKGLAPIDGVDYLDENKQNSNLTYNLNNIANLILNGNFYKKDLLRYCRSSKPLKKIEEKLKEANVGKETVAYTILSTIASKGTVEEFLDWAQQEDDESFEAYKPYLFNEVDSSEDILAKNLSKILERYKDNLPSERKPRLLLAGAAGTGKSSTINCILGKNLAFVSHNSTGTTKDTVYVWEDNDIDLIDVPGLGAGPEKDKITLSLYKRWAKHVDGIIVVVTPPRPADGAGSTIEFLLKEGVPPSQIIFGLNALSTLQYDSEEGRPRLIQFDDNNGPVRDIDKLSVDTLKVKLIQELNQRHTNARFKISQVVEYDSFSKWNLDNLLISVLELLPYQALRKYAQATEEARKKLKKKLKKKGEESRKFEKKYNEKMATESYIALKKTDPVAAKNLLDEIKEAFDYLTDKAKKWILDWIARNT